MKLLVNAERPNSPARCREIRERLANFATGRLRPTATGEVQGHLLDCQECSLALSEMLLEQVATGAIPMRALPNPPPVELYARYVRDGHTRFGTWWSTVHAGVHAARVEERRKWARRLEEIRVGIGLLVDAQGPGAAGGVRTRGAVRTRSAPPPRPLLAAEVLTPAGAPAGTVSFQIVSAPAITAAGHFRARFRTSTPVHDGRQVVCTILISTTDAVSFSGTLARLPDQIASEVHIDEEGFSGPTRDIPLPLVKLTIVAG